MFESNPLRVENIQLDKKKAYHKTQTSVLFKEDEFVAFGQQAERKYKTLSLKGQTDDLFYFETSKCNFMVKSMKLRTIDGKEKSCIIVIAACIEHIKKKANERIKQINKSIGDIDIHWVLTVPAIWSEQARQFMIKAAEKTGIDRDNLSLALEPECAAVYCKHDELVKDENEINSSLQSFKPGSKFMVVDLGSLVILFILGGTVDITVSEVLESGKMKEIKSAKRDYDDEDDFTIRLPEFLQEEVNVDKLAGKFGNNIVLGKGKKHLLFSQEKMKDIFSKCISEITKHITSLLEEAIEFLK
ncbi:unnamed protein product [Mytilus edulis]|uniref:Uncharacterized protein n=1 Tax=Mytilus edulis TaxID=6550 RepID=A0A8S3R245_MYTED|nr:unnamed protein product [Mytilus edulis]